MAEVAKYTFWEKAICCSNLVGACVSRKSHLKVAGGGCTVPFCRAWECFAPSHCLLQKLANVSHGARSGTVYLISAYTGPAYIHRSMHAYWQLPSQKRATKSREVTCRELTPKWCKNGMCRKCLFYGNKWILRQKMYFLRQKMYFLRVVYGLSTVRFGHKQRATSSTNIGFTTRPDVNILILQCVPPSAESSTPDLHRAFRSGFLLAYGFPEWFASGMSMICLYGMSMACLSSICPDQSTRRN